MHAHSGRSMEECNTQFDLLTRRKEYHGNIEIDDDDDLDETAQSNQTEQHEYA